MLELQSATRPIPPDLSSREKQRAHYLAVRARISGASKGGASRFHPRRTTAAQAHGGDVFALSPNAEGLALVPVNVPPLPPADATPSIGQECDIPATLPEYLLPFDYLSFRRAPLAGEADPMAAYVTMAFLTSLVCRWRNVSERAVWGARRTSEVIFARHASWWLTRTHTTMSYPNIGRHSRFTPCDPGFDHSSVIHAVRKFDAWLDGRASYCGVESAEDIVTL